MSSHHIFQNNFKLFDNDLENGLRLQNAERCWWYEGNALLCRTAKKGNGQKCTQLRRHTANFWRGQVRCPCDPLLKQKVWAVIVSSDVIVLVIFSTLFVTWLQRCGTYCKIFFCILSPPQRCFGHKSTQLSGKHQSGTLSLEWPTHKFLAIRPAFLAKMRGQTDGGLIGQSSCAGAGRSERAALNDFFRAISDKTCQQESSTDSWARREHFR